MGKTALVLGGGGSRGAYQIGVWQGLLEMDVPVDIVTGTSVGALNGCMVVQNRFDTAVSLWKEIEVSKVFRVPVDSRAMQRGTGWRALSPLVKGCVQQGGYDNQPLRRLLQQYVEEPLVRQSPVDYGLVTVNLKRRQPVEYFKGQIPAGKLIDYVLASSALYPAVKPQKIDGEEYIDGCYYDNLPVKMALRRGAQHIIAVDLDAAGVVHKDVLKQAEQIHHIRSYWDLGPTLVFDKHTAGHNIRLGYLDCMREFGVLEGKAFAFIKGEIQKQESIQPGFQQELDRLLRLYENSTPAGKAWQANIQRHLEKKYRRKCGILLGAMETAGEVFGLSNETVYSAAQFRRKLAEKINALHLPSAVFGQPAHHLVGTLREGANFFQKDVRTMYLAKLIMETLCTRKEASFLPLAAVMVDEFLAAYYIVSAGVYNGVVTPWNT